MSSKYRSLPLVAVALLAYLGFGVAAGAIAVPILNPGFESDSLAPGAFAPTITSWITSPGGGDGVFRPGGGEYTSGGFPVGLNVAYVNNGPGNAVRQVLTTNLEPFTTYVLQVAVGSRNSTAFAGYVVRLLAGNVVLAEDNPSTPANWPAKGGFITSTVTYTSTAAHAKLGAPLEIYLSAPGIQANFDDVRLSATFAGACLEELLVPSYLVDKADPNGTSTLFAVRNLTGGTVSADLEYFTRGGVRQYYDPVTLAPYATSTVNIRNVPGLDVDADQFARGFVKVRTTGSSDGTPVLAGDFFQVDEGNDSATGDKLARRSDICREISTRFLDFGAGAQFRIYLTSPRGASMNLDPPSFTVQVYDEPGNAIGSPQPYWTADNSLELAASSFTNIPFGSLRFDFTNSLGGTVYAEYSAFGRFSVGLESQCHGAPSCDKDCCPPGALKATIGGIHYVSPEFPDCVPVIANAVKSFRSFHYRRACQQAHGGSLPNAVLGAKVTNCEENHPGFPGGPVVEVEVCCPFPSP